MILSNIAALEIESLRTFWEKKAKTLTKLSIAVGYICEGSCETIRLMSERNKSLEILLLVGVHAKEGFTKGQWDHLQELDRLLTVSVRVITSPKNFHGKVYLGRDKAGNEIGTIGSSNLSGLLMISPMVDVDVVLPSGLMPNHIFEHLLKNSVALQDHKPHFKIEGSPLEGICEKADNEFSRIGPTLEIPLKATSSSNLNAHRAEGRPRSWYEVEINIPAGLRNRESLPRTFTGVTPDGFMIPMRRSGDQGKNLRSDKDLCVLGIWIKNWAQAQSGTRIKPGHVITECDLQAWGNPKLRLEKVRPQGTEEKTEYWRMEITRRP
jgi:hypothetical protein